MLQRCRDLAYRTLFPLSSNDPKDALREVDGLIKDGYTFVVDADLKGYFDSIPRDKLLERVKERISDGRVLGLINSWLKQDVMHDMENGHRQVARRKVRWSAPCWRTSTCIRWTKR